MPVHFSIYSVHINRSKDPRTQFATANHEESDRNVWSIRIKKKKKKQMKVCSNWLFSTTFKYFCETSLPESLSFACVFLVCVVVS